MPGSDNVDKEKWVGRVLYEGLHHDWRAAQPSNEQPEADGGRGFVLLTCTLWFCE